MNFRVPRCNRFFYALDPWEGGEIQNVPSHVIARCKLHLTHNQFFATLDRSTGTIYKMPMAKSGNRVYAGRMTKRLDDALADMAILPTDTLFVTLTDKYEKNEKGISDSWLRSKIYMPQFLRRIRALGFKTYFYVREAHEDGGCHVHIIMKKKNSNFNFFAHNDKQRLDDEALKFKIESAWNGGHVDIQGITSEAAGAYLTKEIGKTSHIEDALKRAEKWIAPKNLSEEIRAKNDKKKLWSLYMATKLKIRRWGVSRDLIKHLTNPTEPEEVNGDVEYIIIPKNFNRNDFFTPYTGAVEKNSPEYYQLLDIFDRVKKLREDYFQSFLFLALSRGETLKNKNVLTARNT